MRLKLTNLIPPGGYRYTEAKLGWTAPRSLGLQGADAVAKELSALRANNPGAGLDAALEVCYQDVVRATYERYRLLPAVLKKYVLVTEDVPVVEAGVVQMAPMVPKIKRTESSCGSCGSRRRVKK